MSIPGSGAANVAAPDRLKPQTKNTARKKPEHYVLTFPPNVSLGTLDLATRRADSRFDITPVSVARGKVSVNVPSEQVLLLELSGQVAANPSLLDSIVNEPIKIIKMNGFYAMEDNVKSATDLVLRHVAKLPNVEELHVSKTDVTDEGLAALKQMPKLFNLDCFITPVQGAFMKELAGKTHLQSLSFSHCDLDQRNLKYLPAFKDLRTLVLMSSKVGEPGFKFIGQCQGLEYLRVSDGPIDDKCLRHLSNLKRLNNLHLGKTRVTIRGIRLLKGMPLTLITVSASVKPSDDAEIRRLFPGIKIHRTGSAAVTQDEMETFAPLH